MSGPRTRKGTSSSSWMPTHSFLSICSTRWGRPLRRGMWGEVQGLNGARRSPGKEGFHSGCGIPLPVGGPCPPVLFFLFNEGSLKRLEGLTKPCLRPRNSTSPAVSNSAAASSFSLNRSGHPPENSNSSASVKSSPFTDESHSPPEESCRIVNNWNYGTREENERASQPFRHRGRHAVRVHRRE